jgi:glycosyltransferase involved in cell wall biosynthesis
VHHGIDLGEFEPTTQAGDDLVILGRIHPDKGTAEAIEIAREAGRRLIICGPVVDARYFAEQVEPFLDDERVIHLGSVGPAERSRVLGASAVLLHPIRFAEPFGLAVIEAMACGTPVVAYRRGSMPELIDEGVTGFTVLDAAAAVEAVERAAELDRAVVRAVAERRFGVERMVDDYLAVYRRLLGG